MLVVSGRHRTEALWVLDRLEYTQASDSVASERIGAVDYRTELFGLVWRLLVMALRANLARAKVFRRV
jgi:hypothetical protein